MNPITGVFQERIQPFIRTHLVLTVISGSTAALFLTLVTLALVSIDHQAVIENTSTATNDVLMHSATKTTTGIVVDVSGAVIQPGVYLLPQGSRVEDAVVAAGGFDENKVDRDFIAREFNLAAKVNDGQKIYILHTGEDKAKIPVSTSLGNQAASGKININSAAVAELESLSGVGAVTANKIITNRPYQSTQDLVNRKIISQATFGKIASQVTAN